MYEDLYKFLVPGFISTTLSFGGHRIGIRSLSPQDLDLLMKVASENDPTWKVWAVAHSIWMVDGMTLLESSSFSNKVIYDFLMGSSPNLVSGAFGTLLSFFERYKQSNLFLESFLYEQSSRRFWQATKNGSIPLWRMTPIPGTERLGVNSVQSAWTTWNNEEDRRDEQEYQWSMAKVMVSMQSHKAAQKLDSKDKSRIQTEQQRRQRVHDEAYLLFATGVHGDNSNRIKVHTAVTAQDLVKEMRRWVAGEMDEHDITISDYKEHIKKSFIQKENGIRETARRAREERERQEAETGVAKPRIVAYTSDQMASLFGGKRRMNRVVEESPITEHFDKYLRNNPTAGNLIIDGDRVVAKSMADAPTLNDLISDRKSVLGHG